VRVSGYQIVHVYFNNATIAPVAGAACLPGGAASDEPTAPSQEGDQ
jgi:hypothetical protein